VKASEAYLAWIDGAEIEVEVSGWRRVRGFEQPPGGERLTVGVASKAGVICEDPAHLYQYRILGGEGV